MFRPSPPLSSAAFHHQKITRTVFFSPIRTHCLLVCLVSPYVRLGNPLPLPRGLFFPLFAIALTFRLRRTETCPQPDLTLAIDLSWFFFFPSLPIAVVCPQPNRCVLHFEYQLYTLATPPCRLCPVAQERPAYSPTPNYFPLPFRNLLPITPDSARDTLLSSPHVVIPSLWKFAYPLPHYSLRTVFVRSLFGPCFQLYNFLFLSFFPFVFVVAIKNCSFSQQWSNSLSLAVLFRANDPLCKFPPDNRFSHSVPVDSSIVLGVPLQFAPLSN